MKFHSALFLNPTSSREDSARVKSLLVLLALDHWCINDARLSTSCLSLMFSHCSVIHLVSSSKSFPSSLVMHTWRRSTKEWKKAHRNPRKYFATLFHVELSTGLDKRLFNFMAQVAKRIESDGTWWDNSWAQSVHPKQTTPPHHPRTRPPRPQIDFPAAPLYVIIVCLKYKRSHSESFVLKESSAWGEKGSRKKAT